MNTNFKNTNIVKKTCQFWLFPFQNVQIKLKWKQKCNFEYNRFTGSQNFKFSTHSEFRIKLVFNQPKLSIQYACLEFFFCSLLWPPFVCMVVSNYKISKFWHTFKFCATRIGFSIFFCFNFPNCSLLFCCCFALFVLFFFSFLLFLKKMFKTNQVIWYEIYIYKWIYVWITDTVTFNRKIQIKRKGNETNKKRINNIYSKLYG